MWNRPLFRNGVIYGLAGAALFRLTIAVTRYIIAAESSPNSKLASDPPILFVLLSIGFFLMAVGGVVAIVASLLIGDNNEHENSNCGSQYDLDARKWTETMFSQIVGWRETEPGAEATWLMR